MAKLHLITYGCQMNEYDSERVAGLLRAQAYELTDNESDADLILLNTCAIREKAEDKVFSKLGQLRAVKARRPDVVVGVMGCMAQLHHAELPSSRRLSEHVGQDTLGIKRGMAKSLEVGLGDFRRKGIPRIPEFAHRARMPFQFSIHLIANFSRAILCRRRCPLL